MNRLRIYRAHETQPQVARATGITVPDISRYETGRSNPTPAQMRALCVHYGTTVDKLMDRAEWDYRLSCPVTRRDKRRAGRGTGRPQDHLPCYRGPCKPHQDAMRGGRADAGPLLSS